VAAAAAVVVAAASDKTVVGMQVVRGIVTGV
jgi:hypothetical protein